MISYSGILQTGIQSLLAVACGWACGLWHVLEPEATVQHVNTLVLKFCIPCLQVWLLAVKTDMRVSGNWSALGVFLLWSLSLQALLALQQLLVYRRLHVARLGIDSLVLTTNNTGILGPVVLQAAVGAKYAPLGMLATVVLYFQQLPSAQVLFQLHQQFEAKQNGQLQKPSGGCSATIASYERRPTSEQHIDHKSNVNLAGVCTSEQQLSQTAIELHQHSNGDSADEVSTFMYGQTWQKQPHQWQQNSQHTAVPGLAAAGGALSSNTGLSLSAVASLLLLNPLVWSTGLSLLLSSLGSSVLLDPASPLAVHQLAFVEQLLGWFAQTTPPLTLFTTGLWMYNNGWSKPAKQGAQPASALSWQRLCWYLLARATVAPFMMTLLCWLFGFRGAFAHAMVILALLPVAQTAFVVCKQHDTGTHEVTGVMMASLLLMLPQLLLTLALLEWVGLF